MHALTLQLHMLYMQKWWNGVESAEETEYEGNSLRKQPVLLYGQPVPSYSTGRRKGLGHYLRGNHSTPMATE